MPVQERGDPLGVVAVPVHPYPEGLDAAQGEPGVERAVDRAHRVLVVAQLARRARRRRRPARHRPRRSARRRTWWWSGPPRPRRARAAAAGTARRRCCRPPAARRRRARRAARAAMSAMPSSGLVGVSTQTIFVSGGSPPRTASRSETCAGVNVQPPALGDLGEQPVRAAVRVVRDHHVVTRAGRRRAAGCPRRPGRWRRRARAGRPPARPGTPGARPGSGCRSGCTRSPGRGAPTASWA